MRRLYDLPSQMTEMDGTCYVSVSLVPDARQAVVKALKGVDRWLVDLGLGEVRVELDEQVYTLAPLGALTPEPSSPTRLPV